jgi:hypothetical protein
MHDPQLMERKEREQLFERRKTFESFRASDPDDVIAAQNLPCDLVPLEAELDKYFQSKKRGIGARVHRKDSLGEIRFLIQHGQTCKREPSRKGSQSTCIFFRPEKTDIVILDIMHHEMRVNASNFSDLRQYRVLFSRHLFGNEDRFVFAPKYTLDPLKRNGTAALNCRDILGIESIRLVEIEYAWGGAFDHKEIHRADDVFKALMVISRAVESNPQIHRAVFKIKLEGEKKSRTLTLKAGNKSAYNRGEEAMLIEEWLFARGFVISQSEEDREKAQAVVASS